ncbi:PHB domain-containing protein [Haematococcus lacustris]|uniref:Prohibitin n=1 Tax=Haematococcus lacustris TaxID=44745 RepID=A0A699YNN5_HAELA|nr:PHB domain-containing protein [Haematococcus lacustris]
MAQQEGAAVVVAALNRVMKWAVGLGVGASVLQTSLYTVDGGERAVMFDRFRGVLNETSGEGTHFRIPWVQTPTIMDIRTRAKTISSVTGTKDLQMVNMSLRMLSKPDEMQLPAIFKNLGVDWEDRVLPSIGNEVVNAGVAAACYDCSQQAWRCVQVRDNLMQRASDFGIVLEDIAITHLSFGVEFTKAVEMKQVAEQDAERAKFVVMKAEQAFGSGIIELRRIEAARDIADTLSRSRGVVYLPNTGNMMLQINPNQ